MADMMEIRVKNMNIILDKLKKRREDLSPNSPAIKRAFTRIALLITNQAKLNIRRKGLIDYGRLLNSLRWEFYRRGDVFGISIGSFGVPYAAYWEFGYHGTVAVRSHDRVITRAFGKPLDQAVIARVRAHRRRLDTIARPYLMPAYERHKERIAEILINAS